MMLFLPLPNSTPSQSGHQAYCILHVFCWRGFHGRGLSPFGPSKVILSSTGPKPASLSALSFPCTPACPGQNIHWMRLSWLLFRETHQSACSLPHLIISSVLIESVRKVTYWSGLLVSHSMASEMALISMNILEVVKPDAPDPSWIVAPCCEAVKAHPDRTPR